MARPVQESEALVVAGQEHGESDRIITFYSRDFGRFTGIAKGACRSKKRFVNKLEPFSLLHLSFQWPRNGSLVFIQEADLRNSFLRLRQDYSIFAAASIIQEMLLFTTNEREQDQNIFNLTSWALSSLNQGQPPRTIIYFYLIRLYDLLGYRPNLSACINCGVKIDAPLPFSFNYQAGGLICTRCKQPGGLYEELSKGTINLLNKALEQELNKLGRLKFSNRAEQETSCFLHQYAQILFQRDFKSWQIFKKAQNS
ncbi:MAG: DNA repair protein RecO [Deltaproteobacteria bacterium]|nr:MAG: DNA repair protein RecO [Deltaproteobacteria bacterium]